MLPRSALSLLLLILFGVWLIPTPADAFCRSRTCKGSGCARDADGCPAEGLPLYWPGSCVGFSFQRNLSAKYDPELLRTAIRRAFFAWTQLPCPGGPATLTFSENEDTSCNASGFDDKGPNVNVVLFRDDDFPYKDEDNTLAKTTVTYDAKTGVILDADIEINSAFNELTFTAHHAVYDLESIMTHEVGHFIGLAHTPVPEATMYASYELGSLDLRTLHQDDIDAVCTVYPPARKAICDPTPRGGQQICGDDGAPSPRDESCSLARPGARGEASNSVLGLALLILSGRRAVRRMISRIAG
ncbi:MAG: matrixin family metalloprotease [Myxococcales bacterium]|nr:matrixin family metalloprotease [Polyangiaceae bacterium]MDW8249313.1 matrixin family metalloprotease [Myxococcales bacterium]